ncbi:hypothetical protein M569_08533 [Genlisea aurea]|uniref:Transcription repressor n=1 Tax=Genlisea aurea TaxID=192259 RepID=S8CHA3_9LAMI|nr:hypothetical protein M569_08533 [Genlisea aurea]
MVKFRFCRGILNSCRSKHPSVLPVEQVQLHTFRRPSPRRRKIDDQKKREFPTRRLRICRTASSPESGYFSSSSSDGEEAAFSSGRRPAPERRSVAVVKRSTNPYVDFRNSMADMIVENRMLDSEDLERLLRCFLSLNSRHYHTVILRAFADILDVVFAPAAVPANGTPPSPGLVQM